MPKQIHEFAQQADGTRLRQIDWSDGVTVMVRANSRGTDMVVPPACTREDPVRFRTAAPWADPQKPNARVEPGAGGTYR